MYNARDFTFCEKSHIKHHFCTHSRDKVYTITMYNNIDIIFYIVVILYLGAIVRKNGVLYGIFHKMYFSADCTLYIVINSRYK